MASLRTQNNQIFQEHSPDEANHHKNFNTKQWQQCYLEPSSTGQTDQRPNKGPRQTTEPLPSAFPIPVPEGTWQQLLGNRHEAYISRSSRTSCALQLPPNSPTIANWDQSKEGLFAVIS